MSRIIRNVVLAAWCGVASPAVAESVVAAITPPLPKMALPSPDIPQGAALNVEAFTPVSMPVHDAMAPVADMVMRQANISNFGSACGPSLSMAVAIDAMLAVRVSAPCIPYDMVRLEHEGLSFTVPMPMTGELDLLLPALTADAVVKVHLSDGTVLSADTEVPDARNYARVALQWDGVDPGALVAKAPKVLDGTLMHLGQSVDAKGSVLHVFSSRMDTQTASGVVRLSVLAPVTASNCKSGHEARVRRGVPGEPAATYDLRLKGLGCDAIGESLELKNVLQDLQLSQY